MSSKNPRPSSAGFIVIRYDNRSVVSELFKRREPARAIATAFERSGVKVGVRQVMLYPGEKFEPATYVV
jgi:hypothetical protein